MNTYFKLKISFSEHSKSVGKERSRIFFLKTLSWLTIKTRTAFRLSLGKKERRKCGKRQKDACGQPRMQGCRGLGAGGLTLCRFCPPRVKKKSKVEAQRCVGDRKAKWKFKNQAVHKQTVKDAKSTPPHTHTHILSPANKAGLGFLPLEGQRGDVWADSN